MTLSPAFLLRNAILEGLDPHLAELGFKRRKGFFTWKRHPFTGVVQCIHLNFGPTRRAIVLGIIPSFGAGFEAVGRELAAAFGLKQTANEACDFGYHLDALLGCEYFAYVDQGAAPMVSRLLADIQRHCLPRLERLSSLETVATLMLSPEPGDWPVTWSSMRARLIPLVLALLGRTKEAHDWLGRLRADLNGHDQVRPDIEHFSLWFVERFGQAA
ncbi:MAG TPA: hypothetical protein VGR43_08590 [Dehalococcoidia bacterium]|jgi:hypothetical protein|nr:hypothetical protein [Dehalococcoidia bacterium]